MIGAVVYLAMNNSSSNSSSSNNVNNKEDADVEFPVGSVADLREGEMREVTAGEAKVLLVRDGGQVYATGNKCTHMGAPLDKAVLYGGRLRCQWHGACFSVRTGDIEDYPCSDALQTYAVRVQDQQAFVRGKPRTFKSHKRERAPLQVPPSLSEGLFLIVGGGPAGLTAAERLRELGYQGRVLIISKEAHLPYDRTKLSKSMSATAEGIALRKADYLAAQAIEVQRGAEVVRLDSKARSVTLKDGSTIAYRGALVATGATPRLLDVPGKDLRHIYALRVPEEAAAIYGQAEGRNLVVVGSSFIGMETAGALCKRAKSVSVIGMERVPFERVLGAEVGAFTQRVFESNGVRFYLEQKPIREYVGENGAVTGVVLATGETLPADLVVIGAGVIPSTAFVADVERQRDGSLVTDEQMRVQGASQLWAAGDLARFPYYLTGELIRVEHYGAAMYQAAIAAESFLGRNPRHHAPPFFWTMMLGKSIRYAGHATSYDEVILDGDLSSPNTNWLAFYLRKDQVLAVAAHGRDPIASLAAELMQAQRMPTGEQVRAAKAHGDLGTLLLRAAK